MSDSSRYLPCHHSGKRSPHKPVSWATTSTMNILRHIDIQSPSCCLPYHWLFLFVFWMLLHHTQGSHILLNGFSADLICVLGHLISNFAWPYPFQINVSCSNVCAVQVLRSWAARIDATVGNHITTATCHIFCTNSEFIVGVLRDARAGERWKQGWQVQEVLVQLSLMETSWENASELSVDTLNM